MSEKTNSQPEKKAGSGSYRKWIVGGAVAAAAIWFLMPGSDSNSEKVATFVAKKGPLTINVLEGGSIEALRAQKIQSEIRGYDVKIISLVDEGYQVTPEDVENGKILVELDSSSIEEKIVTQEITFESTQASLTEAINAREIQISENESSIKQAAQTVRFAKMDFEKYMGSSAAQEIFGNLNLEEKILGKSANWQAIRSLLESAADGAVSEEIWAVPSTPEVDQEMTATPEMGGRRIPGAGRQQNRNGNRGPGNGRPGNLAVAPSSLPKNGSGPSGNPGNNRPEAPSKANQMSEPTAPVANNAASPKDSKTDSEVASEPKESIISNSLIDFSQYANPDKEDMLGDGEARQTLRELQDQKLIAEEELAVAEEELAGTKRLEAKGYVTRNALDKKEISVKQSRLKVQSAATKLNLFIKYELPKAAEEALSAYEEGLQELSRTVSMSIARMAQAEAKVNSARNRYNLESKELKELYQQLDNCLIKADTAGLVVYAQGDRWRDDEQIRVGTTVRQRQEILSIPDMTQMSVQIKIPESYVKMVDKGQAAKIRLEAEPGRVLDGQVTKVSVLPDSGDRWRSPDRKVYTTEVTIDGAHSWLKPGMTAEVEIIVDQLEDVIYVPFQSVNTVDEYHIVFADDGSGDVTLREVTIGQFNDEFIEIKKGVDEGTIVHTKPPKDGPQQIKDFLKMKSLQVDDSEATTSVETKGGKTKA